MVETVYALHPWSPYCLYEVSVPFASEYAPEPETAWVWLACAGCGRALVDYCGPEDWRREFADVGFMCLDCGKYVELRERG